MNKTEIAALRLEIAKACDNWIPEIKIHPKLLQKVLDQLEAERQLANSDKRQLALQECLNDERLNHEATTAALKISRHNLEHQTTLKEKAQDAACTATQNSDRWMSRALLAESQLVALRDALKALDNFVGSL